jgi:hypothetical protein
MVAIASERVRLADIERLAGVEVQRWIGVIF